MTLDDLQRVLWEFARHRVVTVAARAGLLTLLAQRKATPTEPAIRGFMEAAGLTQITRTDLDPDRWLIVGRKPG
jgi:hypothetical protein